MRIKPGVTNLWIDSLTNLDAAAVTEGFQAVMRTFTPTMACPFPTPGHLRTLILTPQAEAAWNRVWRYVDRDWNPDTGWRNSRNLEGKNLMTELETQATDAVGGLQSLFDIDRGHIRWVRQQFIDAYIALSNR